MLKRFAKYFFFVPFLGLILVACHKTESDSSTGDIRGKTRKIRQTSDIKQDTGNGIKIRTFDEAFNAVVQALHAPYNSGDYLFKIFANETKNAVKRGSDSKKSGETNHLGSGTHKVEVAKDQVVVDGVNNICGTGRPITYTYKNYSPKGSNIIINGTLKNTRIDGSQRVAGDQYGEDLIQFCVGEDTLKISGNFDATLKIVNTQHQMMISSENYDMWILGENNFDKEILTEILANTILAEILAEEILGKNDILGLFNNKITFSYLGEEKILDDAKINRLLKVQ